jgi:hypothetical protein
LESGKIYRKIHLGNTMEDEIKEVSFIESLQVFGCRREPELRTQQAER